MSIYENIFHSIFYAFCQSIPNLNNLFVYLFNSEALWTTLLAKVVSGTTGSTSHTQALHRTQALIGTDRHWSVLTTDQQSLSPTLECEKWHICLSRCWIVCSDVPMFSMCPLCVRLAYTQCPFNDHSKQLIIYYLTKCLNDWRLTAYDFDSNGTVIWLSMTILIKINALPVMTRLRQHCSTNATRMHTLCECTALHSTTQLSTCIHRSDMAYMAYMAYTPKSNT